MERRAFIGGARSRRPLAASSEKWNVEERTIEVLVSWSSSLRAGRIMQFMMEGLALGSLAGLDWSGVQEKSSYND